MGLLGELMEDDRICLHYENYRARVQQEMTSLVSFPHLVWELVSGFCGDDVTTTSLKSQVMNSAHTSLGFIDERVWRRCQAWPWRVAIGDIEHNIVELAAMEIPPDESLARKIWALANMDFPREQLVEGVRLLQHVGWTSTIVEQQHASATMVRRVHPTYGLQMICSRALLHTARLFYSVDPLDRELHKLELKLQEQLARTPRAAPANAILFQKVMDLKGYMGSRVAQDQRAIRSDPGTDI